MVLLDDSVVHGIHECIEVVLVSLDEVRVCQRDVLYYPALLSVVKHFP